VTAEEQDRQTIDWYEAEAARWRARGSWLLRLACRLVVAVAVLALVVYLIDFIDLIGSIR